MKQHHRKVWLSLFVVALFVISGCADTKSARIEQLESRVAQQNQELNTLKLSVNEKNDSIELYRRQIEEIDRARRDAETRAEMAEEAGMKAETALLPPDAKPNECYARVFIPPTYATTTERMLQRDTAERVEVVPAQYEWVEEKVLVREASERLEVVPAQYDWVEEKVLVKAASSRMVEVPATYEMVSEKVLVEPAHTIWKKGRGLIEKVDNTTGEIMCLVEVPASYRTVEKRVMTSPPATRSVEIPAEYETVKKRVMVKPPMTRTIEIPAVYKTVKVRKLVSAPQEQRIEIPASYQTVTKTELATEGRMEWRRVLCETNMSPSVISRIQRALMAANHNPGPIDGILGPQTRAAVTSYQREKGLATGALTYKTVESLGVKLGQ